MSRGRTKLLTPPAGIKTGRILGTITVVEFEVEGTPPQYDVNIFAINQELTARLMVVAHDYISEQLENESDSDS